MESTHGKSMLSGHPSSSFDMEPRFFFEYQDLYIVI